MVRNVIFDIGGVVLEWNPDEILKSFYADPDARAAMKSALFLHPDWILLDRGMLEESAALARLEQRTGRPEQELTGLFAAIRGSLRPKLDTIALLEGLARRGVPLYCLSNMPASTFAHLRERHEFWAWFHGIVISGEVKMAKPEQEIFRYLLRRYGLPAAETVFIDDHPPNIEAARSLGLHAIRFRDARQCEIELERLLQN